MSKTLSLHHIVFATKHREKTISEEHKRQLYAYILGIVQNRNCYLIRINGVADHIHMLINLHPSVALADLVRDIKQWSSRWLKDNPKFPDFDSWGEGYFAVSISYDSLQACKSYIINQERHHATYDLTHEIERMSKDNAVELYPGELY